MKRYEIGDVIRHQSINECFEYLDHVYRSETHWQESIIESKLYYLKSINNHNQKYMKNSISILISIDNGKDKDIIIMWKNLVLFYSQFFEEELDVSELHN